VHDLIGVVVFLSLLDRNDVSADARV